MGEKIVLSKMKSDIEVYTKTDYESSQNQRQIAVAIEYRKPFKTINDFYAIFKDILIQIRVELNKFSFDVAYYDFEEELKVVSGPTINRIAVIKLYRK